MAATTNSVQSIDRVFDILETLASVPQGMSLSDLAAATDLHISTAHRLVGTLVERATPPKTAAAANTASHCAFLKLGAGVSNVLSLLSVSREFLDELANFSQEAVHLVERDGHDVVYLYKFEPFQQLVRMASSVGCRNPMYCTGVGKSILAFLPAREVEEIWKQTDICAYTDTTITDLPTMQRELAKIRACGYAMDNAEHESGVRCIAAAIRDWEGRPVGAVSVSAPIVRMDDAAIARIRPKLLSLTQKISQLLGAQ